MIHYIKDVSAASILAKTYHDEHIVETCKTEDELDKKYSLMKNMGYGTKDHIMGLIKYGKTNGHRETFIKSISKLSS